MGTLADWRYLPGGRTVHALVPSFGFASICGVSPAWFREQDWLGHGDDDERAEANRLPRCKRCTRILRVDAEMSEQ